MNVTYGQFGQMHDMLDTWRQYDPASNVYTYLKSRYDAYAVETPLDNRPAPQPLALPEAPGGPPSASPYDPGGRSGSGDQLRIPSDLPKPSPWIVPVVVGAGALLVIGAVYKFRQGA